MTVRVLAPAKINLALHVTGQRADGYHELDTVVAFGPAYDVVHVTAAATNSLEISGPEAGGLAAGGNNLILRAAEAVDVGSAAFQLEKNLPVASGIGGCQAGSWQRSGNGQWWKARPEFGLRYPRHHIIGQISEHCADGVIGQDFQR